jgi:hypothetical protein
MRLNIGQNSPLGNFGGFANTFYWSSTEADIDNAWRQSFSSGGQSSGAKGYNYYVRAIRAF